MAEDIVKLLYRPGSPIILVFHPSVRTRHQLQLISDDVTKDNPFSGGAKWGWENFAIFD